jgi:hypothetical protein
LLGPSCGASRWAAAAAISCVLVGCYAAVAPPGAPCSTTQECPNDQQCVAGSCSVPPGLIDAGVPVPDSAPPDAAPGDGGTVTCQSSEVCTPAKTLGTVSGDVGNQILTAQGSQAAWFRVRVTEDLTFSDGSMQVLAKLTPPAGEDFDVRVYVGADANAVECTQTTGTETTIGNVKQVPAAWQDFTEDASRNVSIEIRPRSASCSLTAKWQLEIDGNAH